MMGNVTGYAVLRIPAQSMWCCWCDQTLASCSTNRSLTPCAQVMIFEGEEKGGSTANDEFFDVLSADFELLDVETLALNEHHCTFSGLHDRCQILRKQ